MLLFFRELIWIRWKNEGCPSLVIPSPPPAENGEAEKEEGGAGKAKLGKRKAPLGDVVRFYFSWCCFILKACTKVFKVKNNGIIKLPVLKS